MNPTTRTALQAGQAHFNARAYFEAHEVWEVAWRVETGEPKLLLQALILVAAGCHKATKGEAAGTVKLLGAALGKLAPFPATHEGLELGLLRDAVTEALAHAERWSHDEGPPLIPGFPLR